MNQEELIIQKNYPFNKALNHAVQGEPQNHPIRGREFLQSEEWRKFQEAVGRRTFNVSGDNFYASIIEHKLPIIGSYFYIPRGPICHLERNAAESKDLKEVDSSTTLGMTELLDLAKKNKAGWVRIDANSRKILGMIKNAVGADLVSAQKGQTQGLSLQNYKIVKSPHDMQPREILVMDIAKSEEELLAGMKAKTRYNIKVAQKHNVSVKVVSNINCHPERNEVKSKDLIGVDSSTTLGMTCEDYVDEFIKLVKITSKRDKITPHPESYYRKMFEIIPPEILKLYVAEYENKIIAANIVIFYGNTATYLHGASDNEYRNVMAPYLLQWQAILDAKKAGLERYDLGGVRTCNIKHEICNNNSWSGITRFKLGFSPNTEPIVYPGSYDIILKPFQYYLYQILQRVKSVI